MRKKFYYNVFFKSLFIKFETLNWVNIILINYLNFLKNLFISGNNIILNLKSLQ